MKAAHTEKLFHQLHRCMNLLHRGHHKGQDGQCGHHSHRGQGKILALLSREDGLSQRDLAEKLYIRPSSLSEVLDKMGANGLIERRQQDDDKRVSLIFLTPKGLETATQVEASQEKIANELLEGFSAEEHETLSKLLDKLVDTLEAKFGGAEEARHEGCGHHGHHGHGEKHGHHGHHGHCNGEEGRTCGNHHEHHHKHKHGGHGKDHSKD